MRRDEAPIEALDFGAQRDFPGLAQSVERDAQVQLQLLGAFELQGIAPAATFHVVGQVAQQPQRHAEHAVVARLAVAVRRVLRQEQRGAHRQHLGARGEPLGQRSQLHRTTSFRFRILTGTIGGGVGRERLARRSWELR